MRLEPVPPSQLSPLQRALYDEIQDLTNGD